LILNGDPFANGITVYGLRNVAVNRTDIPDKLFIMTDPTKFAGENTLNVGLEGWLQSDQTYLETRTALENIPLKFLSTNILALAPNPNDILLANNIFTFISPSAGDDFKDRCSCKIVGS
jgi:hypothetical protein